MQTVASTAAETCKAVLYDPRIKSSAIKTCLVTLLALEYPESPSMTRSLRRVAFDLGYADARPLTRAVKVGVQLGHLEPMGVRLGQTGPWMYRCRKVVAE